MSDSHSLRIKRSGSFVDLLMGSAGIRMYFSEVLEKRGDLSALVGKIVSGKEGKIRLNNFNQTSYLELIPSLEDSDQPVSLIFNSKKVLSLPLAVLNSLISSLISVAKEAENESNVSQLISDQALLMRQGNTLGLTDNKEILKEAHQESQWNRDLRRYLRDTSRSVKSEELVRIPSISTTK